MHCDNGCMIHEAKPSECTDFDCEYAKAKKAHTDVRPDNCGVMFEKLTERIILGTLHPMRELDDEVCGGQINHFCNSGISVIVKKPGGETNVYLSEDHTGTEIREEFNNYILKRYGSSQLHN